MSRLEHQLPDTLEALTLEDRVAERGAIDDRGVTERLVEAVLRSSGDHQAKMRQTAQIAQLRAVGDARGAARVPALLRIVAAHLRERTEPDPCASAKLVVLQL